MHGRPLSPVLAVKVVLRRACYRRQTRVMKIAYTRAVSPHLVECELTHIGRAPIDLARAMAQHAAYEAALAQAGLRVVRLPDLPGAADGVFVEDTAVLLDGHAIITRPGTARRADETASTARALAADFIIHHLGGGRLDGGDVLRVGRRLYCGLSARTDARGFAALAEIAAPLGFATVAVPVHGCLHLKTGVTYLGKAASIGDDGSVGEVADADERAQGTAVLLCNPDWIDTAPFAGCRLLPVAAGEAFAANTLRVGDRLHMAAGAPGTEALLRRHGFAPIVLEIDELQKAEAGLTCLSLIG